MSAFREKCRLMLVRDEGFRKNLYLCPAGKHTIGIGHNLDDRPISARAVDLIFEDDLSDAVATCRRLLGDAFERLSENRKAGLVNLAFNLGEAKLSKFVRTLRAIKHGDWATAEQGLRESLYFRQLGNKTPEVDSRAERVIRMICHDEFPY